MSTQSPPNPIAATRTRRLQPEGQVEERPPGPRVLGGDVVVDTPRGLLTYANLDYAASAPCAVAAQEAVNEILPYYASVHRGAGALSQKCTRGFEHARQTLGWFIGARPEDLVVFTRSTTDSLNLLAHLVPADAKVVTFAGEHHANLLPWRDPIRLPVPATPAEAVASAEAALTDLRRTHTGPILLAVTGASNVTGEVWPVAELARVARSVDARIALDAAQLAPHRRVDMAELDVDYLALSGHKLYAPFGAGILAGRSDWMDAATPYLAGGGASALVGDAAGDVSWHPSPSRHEAGSPNVIGAIAMAAVCTALDDADWDAMAAHEHRLVATLREGLATVPGARELSIFGTDADRVGIVTFAVAGHDSSDVSAFLAKRYGIGVRDGLFCSHPLTRGLLREAGSAECTLPPTAVRASVGLGSKIEHIDRLVDGLRELTSGD
ncbi:aminotransferase class V-fold PLP-dependent enzyme [Actinokineospora xionganensis]|uniref:Aminotransferase class V-fold PLP-dependent enzyme n=1 Tax=Actinokineospora xionganensis TaxID=2684470 RepID=A0ABR7L6H9_9PSEU|nr:aminotransferase class V-fold PLP-dependent enzyme [Actinokineospora xionganensis]MBC6447922.1 aminotransferase class V-fold PLP-dependent enzyme [Actinokineospora xionganensis]